MAENNNSLLAGIISIHAPPRGATLSKDEARDLAFISIHAPPRGATKHIPCPCPFCGSFQFTPLREGRPACGVQPDVRKDISIHAPPRGATKKGLGGQQLIWRFQFTPLREGRRGKPCTTSSFTRFQFTPLREGRRQKICNFCKSFVQPLQISMA